jgi:hypothetical protein
MLADLLVAIDEATTPVKSASEPSTSSSDLSLLAQLMTPADKTKEPEQREANAKLISAAAAIQGDQAAWARLAEMKRLYDAKDYATLTQLKESEQNANVLRLLLADVPDIQSTLQGRLPVDKIDLICDVRRAYLVRLLHVLFPSSKPEHVPPRVKTAVHNLMIGRLGRTKLLELIDHGHDPHKIEDPLAGFAALPEPRARDGLGWGCRSPPAMLPLRVSPAQHLKLPVMPSAGSCRLFRRCGGSSRWRP